MSGTSLDGVDAAILRTDGQNVVQAGASLTLPYTDQRREDIRRVFGRTNATAGEIATVAHDLTIDHVAAVQALLDKAGLSARDIDLIGFHGQTIFHDPENGITTQIGVPGLLATAFDTPVVADFRTADVQAGGQGAPLIPLYHAALARAAGCAAPVAFLNIGGVGNVTWIGPGEYDLIAFDTGPGNALIDDAVLQGTGQRYDADGTLARQGRVDQGLVDRWLSHPYFTAPAPKSLDRGAFAVHDVARLSLADQVATLTAFTVQSILAATALFPAPVKALYVCGGGRHNAAMMDALSAALPFPVQSVETLGYDGDALEAQGFAYLAVRSRLHLPLSLPDTTGVPRPLTGGVVTLPPGGSIRDTGGGL